MSCPPGSAITNGISAFWGKSIYIRNLRNFFDSEGAHSVGVETVYMNIRNAGQNRNKADEFLRDGFKVGWWLGQSDMVPEEYVRRINAVLAVANAHEPLVFNWEQAPKWVEESDRSALYAFTLEVLETHPVALSTFGSYRWHRHASRTLGGKVAFMPEQYDLTNPLDEPARVAQRASLERFWGVGNVLPTVAGYRRSVPDMTEYLTTFNSIKGTIMWADPSVKTKAAALRSWQAAAHPPSV